MTDNIIHVDFLGEDVRYKTSGLVKKRYEYLRKDNEVQACEEETSKLSPDMPRILREVFSRIYDPTTKLVEGQNDSAVARLSDLIHQELDKLTVFKQLQHANRYNATGSAAAMMSIAADLIDNEVFDDLYDDDLTEEENEEELEEWVNFMQDEPALLRSKLNEVVENAIHVSNEVKACGAIFGLGPGSNSTRDAESSIKLAKLLKDDRQLKQILELLGNFQRSQRKARLKMSSPGKVVPYNVKPGKDIKDLLPVERARLGNPATSLHTLNKLVRGQTLCRKRRYRSPKKRGPFVVALDKSGSMAGELLVTASAYAVAALMMAHEEGREVSLLMFDNTSLLIPLDFSSPSAKLDTITSICNVEASGGTDFNSVLSHEAVVRGKDILLITDGCGRIDDEIADKALKDSELHYIDIGGWGLSNLLDRADTYYDVRRSGDLVNNEGLSAIAANAARVR